MTPTGNFNAAFWRWFGASVVTGTGQPGGQPQVVYHGSTSPGFSEFEVGEGDIGIHFGTVGQANDRAQFASQVGRGRETAIYPCYIRVERPLVLKHDPGAWDWHNLPFALGKTGLFSGSELAKLKEYEHLAYEAEDQEEAGGYEGDWSEFWREWREKVQELLRRHGYDGIKYWNTGEIPGMAEIMGRVDKARSDKRRLAIYREKEELEKHGDWSWAVLDPTQIKSIHNVGTWDPEDPDIRRNPVSGEWWIDDTGFAVFADGDTGDTNHESYAFWSALGLDPEETTSRRRKMIENNWDFVLEHKKSFPDDEDVQEADAFDLAASIEDLCPSCNISDMQVVALRALDANEKAVEFLRSGMADAREYAIVQDNWIRVHGNNFELQTFDDDALGRIRDFIFENFPEDENPDREEFYIEEHATKKLYTIDGDSLLNSGKSADALKFSAMRNPRRRRQP